MRIPGIVLHTPADWHTGRMINVQADEHGLTLQTEWRYSASGRFPVAAIGTSLHSLAADNNGRLYMLDGNGTVSLLDPAYPAPEPLLTAGTATFPAESVLLGTHDRFAVIPLGQHHMLIGVYASANGQCLWLQYSNTVEQDSYTLAAELAEDRLYILRKMREVELEDAVDDRSWRYEVCSYDWQGRSIAKYDLPDQLDVDHHNTGVIPHREERWMLAISQQQMYIAAPFSGTVWMRQPDGEISGFSLRGCRLHADLIGGSDGRVYAGVQDLEPDGTYGELYLASLGNDGSRSRIAGYSGQIDMLLAGAGQLFTYDASAAAVTVFRRSRMIRSPNETGGLPRGMLMLPSIDSGLEDNVWHNIQLDADIPPETRMIVYYLAADTQQIQWRNEVWTMDDWLMSPKVSDTHRLHYIHQHWSVLPHNPHNAIFPDATGRYIWVALEFYGSWAQAPVLRQLELFYPRSSLMEYLPELYQQSDRHQFLERFLSIFGHFFRELHQQIDHMPRVLDPQLSEGEFLRWLAGWVGLAADDSWDDELLRRYLQMMPELYRIRGTKEAMLRTLELLTGTRPHILEHFQYKHLLHDPDWKRTVQSLYSDMPYSFVVLIPPGVIASERQKEMLQRVINGEKPVMTEAALIVLEPRIRLGGHTYLEVNSILSHSSRLAIDEQSVVSYDTVLTDGNESAVATFPFRMDEAITLEH